MSTSRIASITLYSLMAISLVLILWFYFGGYVEGTEGTNIEEPIITDKIILWAYILFFIAAVIALIFPLFYVILNPRSALRTVIILGIIAVLVFISYQLASDEILSLQQYTGPDNVPGTLKRVGTGIILTYILAGLAVLGILVTEISKIFK